MVTASRWTFSSLVFWSENASVDVVSLNCARVVFMEGSFSGCPQVRHVVHRRAAAPVGREQQLEVVRARRRADGLLDPEPALLHVREERLVEGLHPVVAA